MTDSETVTIRVWRGRHNSQNGDPDETHELELHDGDQRNADTIQVNDSIRDVGWLAFDAVDLPDDVEEVTVFVHATDSFHDPEPLSTRAVDRGLVFDGRPYKPGVDAPCFHLEGIVEVHVAKGGR